MDGLIYKVCSIKKEIETWKFYDLEGKQLREPSENTYFPSSMNRRYRAKRKKMQLMRIFRAYGF